MVAIAIAGIVILTAHRILHGPSADGGESGHRWSGARESLDRSANGRRWLKATVSSSLEPPF